MCAADDDHVAHRGAVRPDVDPVGHQPDAGGVHVHLITVSGVDDLGVSGDDPHPGDPGRVAHVLRDPADHRQLGALLQDEAARQV